MSFISHSSIIFGVKAHSENSFWLAVKFSIEDSSYKHVDCEIATN
jgi:hypothetical protein